MGSDLFDGDCLTKPARVSRRTFATHGMQPDLAGDLSLDVRPSAVLSLHNALSCLRSALRIRLQQMARVHSGNDRRGSFHCNQISARSHQSSCDHRVDRCCFHSRLCHRRLSAHAEKCGLKSDRGGALFTRGRCRSCYLKCRRQWRRRAFHLVPSSSCRRVRTSGRLRGNWTKILRNQPTGNSRRLVDHGQPAAGVCSSTNQINTV